MWLGIKYSIFYSTNFHISFPKIKIIMHNMDESIIKKIKSRKLSQKDYSFVNEFESTLKLSDNILMYNSGEQWKIIPLSVALTYPIIYDTFTFNDVIFPGSIIVCPITLRAVIMKGVFEVETYLDTKMIIKDEDNNIMPIDMGYKVDSDLILHANKRIDVKISNLRTVVIGYTNDSIFLKPHDKTINPVLDKSYYSNTMNIMNVPIGDYLIHPKTLVYIIQYKSYKNNAEKISIVLGRDCVKNKVTGYDLKKSGLFDYLHKFRNKIINRSGYTMPILWYIAKDIYPEAKVVYIGTK